MHITTYTHSYTLSLSPYLPLWHKIHIDYTNRRLTVLNSYTLRHHVAAHYDYQCRCIYIDIDMYVYIYIHIFLFMYKYVLLNSNAVRQHVAAHYEYQCRWIYIDTDVYVCIYVHFFIYIYIYILLNSNWPSSTYAVRPIHTHIHTCTHAYTQESHQSYTYTQQSSLRLLPCM